MASSIFGDPKIFDLQKQTQLMLNSSKPDWKSPMSKLPRKINDDLDGEFSGNNIHICILEFIEGFNPQGPSLHTFKLAMLNKKMH